MFFYTGHHHVSIYTGGGIMINAPAPLTSSRSRPCPATAATAARFASSVNRLQVVDGCGWTLGRSTPPGDVTRDGPVRLGVVVSRARQATTTGELRLTRPRLAQMQATAVRSLDVAGRPFVSAAVARLR